MNPRRPLAAVVPDRKGTGTNGGRTTSTTDGGSARRGVALRWLVLGTAFAALFLFVFGAGAAVGSTNPKALILGSTISPGVGPCTTGGGSFEECGAIADGFDVTVVDDATWGAMTAADFAQYQVLIIGDPTCGDTVDGAAGANAAVWQPVVMASGGNRVIIGTDPVYHSQFGGGNATTGGPKLIQNGIAFAGAVSGATGAYVDISCESSYTSSDTPFSFLDGLTTRAAGSFTTEDPPCEGAISVVAQSGPTSGLHDSDLSDWGCSVHQAFKTWASDYSPLAIATDASIQPYCANDVDTAALACGEPYLLVAGTGVTVTSNISLTPPSASNPVSTSHTVTATVKDSVGDLAPGKTVTFSVDSGPDAGATGTCSPVTCISDANGQVTFTYTNNGTAGTDTITASFVDDLGAIEKATATKAWTSGTGGTITVHKTVDAGGASPTSFCFTLSPDPGNGQVCANSSGDAVFNNVPAGTYDATETASPATYHQVSNDCKGLAIAGGDSQSCDVHDTINPGSADLEITKVDAPDPVTAGANLTYTLSVKNNGPDAAAETTVTDVLPAGVAFVSASPSCSGTTTVTCSLGTVASGDTATVTITVSPAAAGALSNTATVSSSITDPVPANNSATATTTVNAAPAAPPPAPPPSADLAITKVGAPEPVTAGSNLTYTVTVKNNGPDQAAAVTVTDPLPAGATFVSATAPCTGTTTVTCALGALANGATATVTIVVTPAAAGSLSNTATVSSSTADPVSTNNSATAGTTVAAPPPPAKQPVVKKKPKVKKKVKVVSHRKPKATG